MSLERYWPSLRYGNLTAQDDLTPEEKKTLQETLKKIQKQTERTPARVAGATIAADVYLFLEKRKALEPKGQIGKTYSQTDPLIQRLLALNEETVQLYKENVHEQGACGD